MAIFLPVTLASDGTTPSVGANWGDPIYLGVNLPYIPVATHLVVTANPTSVSTGAPFSFTVNAVDASNAVVTTYTGIVTVTHPTGAGSLGGTTSMACVAGVAAFTDLTISAQGMGNILHATSGTLTAADSTAFNVITYLARDFVNGFTPAASAPLTTPRTSVPGPGTLTIGQSQNTLSVINGRLTENYTNATSLTWGDQKAVGSSAVTRAANRVYCAMITAEDFGALYAMYLARSAPATNPTTDTGYGLIVSVQGELAVMTPVGVVKLSTSILNMHTSQYVITVVLQATGAVVMLSTFADDYSSLWDHPLHIPGYPSGAVVWVDQSDTTASLYQQLSLGDTPRYTYAGGTIIEDARTFDTVDPAWQGDNAQATVYQRFTGSNTTSTLPNASNGQAWALYADTAGGTPTARINSNTAAITGTKQGKSLFYVAGAPADGVFVCDLTVPSAANANPLFAIRANGSNAIFIILDADNGVFKVRDAANTNIYQTGKTFTRGSTYTLQVFVSGTKMLPLVNGTQVTGNTWLTLPPTNQTVQGVGIGTLNNTSAVIAVDVLFSNLAAYPLTLPLPAETADGAVPFAGTELTTINSDAFAGTAATGIVAHNAAWTQRQGTWVLDGAGKVYCSAYGGSDNFITQTVTFGGGLAISANLTINSPEGSTLSGLAFYVDATHYIFVRCYQSPSQLNSDEIELVENYGSGGAISRKTQLGDAYIPGTTYNLKLHIFNGCIYVYLDGKAKMVYRHKLTIPSTVSVGIYEDMNAAIPVHFDSWNVTSLLAPVLHANPTLQFQTQPVGAGALSPLSTQPVVAVYGSDGTINAAYTGPVTFAITAGTGGAGVGAVLGGTTTVNAVAGIATATNLTVDRGGTGFTLTATASGYSNAISSSFAIVGNFLHTFSHADSSTSTGIADTGQSPINFNSSVYGISSGQAVYESPNGSGTEVVWDTGGTGDGTWQVDFSQGNSQWFLFRGTDKDNHFIVGNTGLGTAEAYKKVAGSYSSAFFSVAGVFTSGPTMLTLKVVTSGSVSHCYTRSGGVDTLFGTITDSFNATATQIGLRATNTGDLYDNLSYIP